MHEHSTFEKLFSAGVASPSGSVAPHVNEEQNVPGIDKILQLVQKTQHENEALKKENAELRQMLNHVLQYKLKSNPQPSQ